jgi:hypothetical protein
VDPTPAWKADILARARREAMGIPLKKTLPPRWLMHAWAAAWVAILLMHFASPSDPASEVNHFAGTKSGNSDRLEAGSFYSITPLLFAQIDRLNLNFQ